MASVILSGDPVTGVTIMKMDEGMDSGPIVARQETSIGPQENAQDLTDRLFHMGASLLVEVLPGWAQGQIDARPQDESQATVTRRLSREDGEVDWGASAVRIARQVLAYQPWPGSFTYWQGKLLKIIEASSLQTAAMAPYPPGLVVPLPGGGLGIATGEGVLAVLRLQLEGRRAVPAHEFIQGYPGFLGAAVG